jgi:hypothetical protein
LNYVSIVSELNIFTDLTNEHCTLEFDLLDNVISGDEIIVTDDFIVKCTNRDFTNLEYYLKLKYYYIPADVDGSRTGEIPIERLVKLDEGNNTISFTDYPIYLSGDCELIINKIDEEGYKKSVTQVNLTTNQESYFMEQDIILTAKVTHNGLPVSSETVTFKDGNNTIATSTTNSNGIATYTIVGGLPSGNHSLTAEYSDFTSKIIPIVVENKYIFEFSVSGYNCKIPEWGTRDSAIIYDGELIIDWGDGNTETRHYNSPEILSHSYSTNEIHTIRMYGIITELGDFYASNLINVTVPSSVTKTGWGCFSNCVNLISITLPKTISNIITPLGNDAYNLRDIILNWSTSEEILSFDTKWDLENSPNATFSIPNGTTNLYTAKGYPADKLIEREE